MYSFIYYLLHWIYNWRPFTISARVMYPGPPPPSRSGTGLPIVVKINPNFVNLVVEIHPVLDNIMLDLTCTSNGFILTSLWRPKTLYFVHNFLRKLNIKSIWYCHLCLQKLRLPWPERDQLFSRDVSQDGKNGRPLKI